MSCGISWRPRWSLCALSPANPSSTIWLLGGELFYLQTELLHQPTPFLFISADIGGIGLGRSRQAFGAFCSKTALYIVAGKRRVEFLVQARYDRGWRPRWRGKTIPQDGFKTRHTAFGERRQIREQARSCRTGDRQTAQRSSFHIADRDGHRKKHHRNMTAKEIAYRRTISLVRHVLQFHAGFAREVFAGQ